MENKLSDAEWREIMENSAVTNVAGWTEPNNDCECDEEAYRQRLAKNGPIFQQIEPEVFKFE